MTALKSHPSLAVLWRETGEDYKKKVFRDALKTNKLSQGQKYFPMD